MKEDNITMNECLDELSKRNKVLSRQSQKINQENEELKKNYLNLKSFEKTLLTFQEKFPGISIEKLIERFDYIEDQALKVTKENLILEDEKKISEKERQKWKHEFEEKYLSLIKLNNEREKNLSNIIFLIIFNYLILIYFLKYNIGD